MLRVQPWKDKKDKKNYHTDFEKTYGIQRRQVVGGDSLGFGMEMRYNWVAMIIVQL